MSDSDRDDVTVSADGITVRKSLNTEQYKSPLIIVNVRSAHDEPVRLQLIEAIPAALSMENIGFHPDYGAEYWSIEENSVVFERTFDQDEEYTTIYGIHDLDGEIREVLNSEPEINYIAMSEMEDSAEGLDDFLSRENSQSIKDVISGDRNTLPGLENDVQAEDTIDDITATAQTGTASGTGDSVSGDNDTDVRTDSDDHFSGTEEHRSNEDELPDKGAKAEKAEGSADAEADMTVEDPGGAEETDPTKRTMKSGGKTETETDLIDSDAGDESAVVAADDTATEADSVAPKDEVETPTRPVGNVGRALAKELREDAISEEDRQLLRNELAISEGSTEVRIQHLQNQMSDFTAYINALEEFIDEEGTAQEVLDELTDEMDGLDNRMVDYQNKMANVRGAMDDLRKEVRSLHEDLDGVEERVNEVETLQEHQDDFETELAAVRDDVDEVAQFRERLETTFGSLTGSVESGESDGET